MSTNAPNASHSSIRQAIEAYADNRIRFYRTFKTRRLLTKDIVMFALHGVSDVDTFVNEAFMAFESSSEETVIGNMWQDVIKSLAHINVVDAGDLLAESDGTLWIIEIKSQENTLNSSSLAQTVRSLKSRAEHHRSFHVSRRREVMGLIGILRGNDKDEIRSYTASSGRTENVDISGFRYRYIVGRPLWQWLTGHDDVVSLLGDIDAIAQRVHSERIACQQRLRSEMRDILLELDAPFTIQGLLQASGRVSST